MTIKNMADVLRPLHRGSLRWLRLRLELKEQRCPSAPSYGRLGQRSFASSSTSSHAAPSSSRPFQPSLPRSQGFTSGRQQYQYEEPRFRFRKEHFTPLIGPMILLSVCTSVAYNQAVLRTERREEKRLHQRRKAALLEARSWLEAKASRSGKGSEDAKDERRLILRLLRIGLDPSAIGFEENAVEETILQSKSPELLRFRAGETSWKEAFFGRPGAIKGSMMRAVENAGKSFDGWRSGKAEGNAKEIPSNSEASATSSSEDWKEWERALQDAIATDGKASAVVQTQEIRGPSTEQLASSLPSQANKEARNEPMPKSLATNPSPSVQTSRTADIQKAGDDVVQAKPQRRRYMI